MRKSANRVCVDEVRSSESILSPKVLSIMKGLVTQAIIVCVCVYVLFTTAVIYSEYIDLLLGLLVNMTGSAGIISEHDRQCWDY
jgi:hypothetical protein